MLPVRCFTVVVMYMCCGVESLIYPSCTGCFLPNNPFVFIGEVGIFNCTPPSKSTLNSSSLYFSIRNEERVDSKFYRVISPNVLQLRLPIPDAGYDDIMISCHMDGCVIQQVLSVDYPPRPASELSVLVHGWSSMSISWELGTYIHTPLVHMTWRSSHHSSWRECDEGNTSYCVLGPGDFTEDTSYSINITVTNTKTDTSTGTQFHFSSGDYVQPAAVSEVRVIRVDSRCVELRWTHSHSHSRNLTYRLSLHSTNKEHRQKTDPLTTSQRTSELVCGLRPDTEYRVGVSVRPTRGGLWSESQSVNFTTLQDYPEEGAVTTDGGFVEEECTEDVRTVYVFLVPPDEFYWNGRLTNYKLVYVPSDASPNISFTPEIDVVFDTAQLNCRLEYNVYIYVYNKIGGSPSSLLHIPRQDKVPLPSYVRIEEEKKGFKLLWEAPVLQPSTRSFTWTLAWCEGKDRTCRNRLQWRTVASSETDVAIPYRETELYGVSLQSEAGSSGIVWTNCLYDVDRVPGPPRTVSVLSVRDYSLTVRWDPRPCQDNTLVSDYTVHYCRHRYTDCHVITVANTYSEYVIRGLEGGVNYSVRVRQGTVSGRQGPYIQPVFTVTRGLSQFVVALIVLSSSVAGFIVLATALVCLRTTRLKWSEKELIILPYYRQVSPLDGTHTPSHEARAQSGRDNSSHWTNSPRLGENDDETDRPAEIASVENQGMSVCPSVLSVSSVTDSSRHSDTDETSDVDPYVTAGDVVVVDDDDDDGDDLE